MLKSNLFVMMIPRLFCFASGYFSQNCLTPFLKLLISLTESYIMSKDIIMNFWLVKRRIHYSANPKCRRKEYCSELPLLEQFKAATKSRFTCYSCALIILFKRIYEHRHFLPTLFWKLVFRLNVLSMFFVLYQMFWMCCIKCVVSNVLNKDIKICLTII